MKPGIININNFSEEEVNEFVIKFLSVLQNESFNEKEELFYILNDKLTEINSSYKRKKMLNDGFKKIKKKSHKNNIIESLFEMISFFEKEEDYEKCAVFKKTKDNLLMDF